MKRGVLTIPALLAMTVWNCPSETLTMVISLYVPLPKLKEKRIRPSKISRAKNSALSPVWLSWLYMSSALLCRVANLMYM